jgi:class 3 adenylate cyclase
LNWTDLGVSELLPAGMVTLLLADAEDSTRLWETQPEQMAAAIARLKRALSEAILEHDGVLPADQGEGDSFVVAFARASDAVACALQLQRAPLAPIGYVSVWPPARCSCVTRVITPVRPSTGLSACAVWPTVARPCCRVRPRT